MAAGDKIYLINGNSSQGSGGSGSQVLLGDRWVDLDLGEHNSTSAAEVVANERGGVVDGMYFYSPTLLRVYKRISGNWRANSVYTSNSLGTSTAAPPSQGAVKVYVDNRSPIGEVYTFYVTGNTSVSTSGGSGGAIKFDAPDAAVLENPSTALAKINGSSDSNSGTNNPFISLKGGYIYHYELNVHTASGILRSEIVSQHGGSYATSSNKKAIGVVHNYRQGGSTNNYMGLPVVGSTSLTSDSYISFGCTSGTAFLTTSSSFMHGGKGGILKVTVIGRA